MPRLSAFVKGINVGGHRISMDRLRALFDELGFAAVETLIASGNVLFETRRRRIEDIETTIERHLQKSLGFEAPTCVRTADQVQAIAQQSHFVPTAGETVYVMLLKNPPGPNVVKLLEVLKTDDDEFAVGQQEVYWLRRDRISNSRISPLAFTKALGCDSTSRNLQTMQKVAGRLR